MAILTPTGSRSPDDYNIISVSQTAILGSHPGLNGQSFPKLMISGVCTAHLLRGFRLFPLVQIVQVLFAFCRFLLEPVKSPVDTIPEISILVLIL